MRPLARAFILFAGRDGGPLDRPGLESRFVFPPSPHEKICPGLREYAPTKPYETSDISDNASVGKSPGIYFDPYRAADPRGDCRCGRDSCIWAICPGGIRVENPFKSG